MLDLRWFGLILLFWSGQATETVVGNPTSAVKRTFPSTLLISKVTVEVTHQALLVLTLHWHFCPCDHWSDFQISYLYIRIQWNKLNFCLTFWCLSTSGSSVSVSYQTGCSWSLLIYQDPYFAKRYSTSACLCVEDTLQPGPLGVCLLTACRAFSESFSEYSGPSFSVLDNCSFFQNTK